MKGIYMKRKLPALLLAVSITLSSCRAAEQRPADVLSADSDSTDSTAAAENTDVSVYAPGEIIQAENHALSDLFDYIYSCESIYTDILGVLDRFGQFDKEKNWKNLQLSKAGLYLAENEISRCSLPEAVMTMEDEMRLLGKGADVSFIETLAESFASAKTTSLNYCGSLRSIITNDVMLKEDWELSVRRCAVMRNITEHQLRYLANTADWTLASINDPAQTEAFGSMLKEYCPLTSANRREIPKDPGTIEEETAALLDETEELLLELSKLLGAQNNRFNRFSDTLENKDIDALAKDILTIDDLPPVIFCPSWYTGDDIFYYWEENDEVQKTPSLGNMPDRAPDGCQIRITGVTSDNVKEYMAELESFGLPCMGISESDEKLTVLYTYGSSEFALICENDEVKILMTEEPVYMVPRWYMSVLLYAGADASSDPVQ